MSVILKQRTYRDENGKAVEHGDVTARFLVGPAGAKVTDQQALELGLKDGAIRKKRKSPAQDKSVKPDQDKESKGEDDKSSDGGTPDQSPPTDESVANDPDKRSTAIIKTMKAMVEEGDKKLFTAKGLPDTYVLSTRLEFQVTMNERDDLWNTIIKGMNEKDSGE